LVSAVGGLIAKLGCPVALIACPVARIAGLIAFVTGLVPAVGGLVSHVGGFVARIARLVPSAGYLVASVAGLVTHVAGLVSPLTCVVSPIAGQIPAVGRVISSVPGLVSLLGVVVATVTGLVPLLGVRGRVLGLGFARAGVIDHEPWSPKALGRRPRLARSAMTRHEREHERVIARSRRAWFPMSSGGQVSRCAVDVDWRRSGCAPGLLQCGCWANDVVHTPVDSDERAVRYVAAVCGRSR
jgi:hypothetical protein